MVPPTPLASLSSLADRFATIIHHRQGPYLTPGNHIVIQNLGCFLFGRFRLPIFTCDRIFSFGEIHFSGVFCPVVLGTLYFTCDRNNCFYLHPRNARPPRMIALAAALTLGPICSSRTSLELEPPVIPCWMSPCVGLLLLCDRLLVWVEGARDFARDFALDFGRGAGASGGISSDRLA